MSTLLLSLLPPSCMVVSKRDSVNILFPFTINPTNSLQDHSATTPMDIKIDTSRGWFSGHNSNSSRESLVLSNISSVAYVDHIQVMANCLIWAEQVKHREKNFPPLSYTFLKEGVEDSDNTTSVTKNTCAPYVAADINTCIPWGLEPTVIPYQENQPIDSLL